MELARFGRLGEDYAAPFDVVDRGEHHRVRRYATGAPEDAPVALLIPPLMVTAEVYDVEAATSAVAALGGDGIWPYVVDFGAPEREAGGMQRSLDDHVRAIDHAIDRVRALSGRDVHLCGYSQGGMFAYQVAAYRRSQGIASIVTFGSPVDLRRQLPALPVHVTSRLLQALGPGVDRILSRIEGLPGKLTSIGFKVVSARKEVQQRLEFLALLHDRSALLRRDARRRFLNGGGFVAWPAPALRGMIDQFVVHNRMLSGGFVIDGRSLSLADIASPILAFVGTTDEIARPSAVRAIAEAAPRADVSFVNARAGHFGIVVGSRARAFTWPTVSQWIRHHEGLGPLPEVLRRRDRSDDPDDLDVDVDLELQLFFETASRAVRSAARDLGGAVASAQASADAVRYQEPRLRRLARLEPDTRVSPALELAARAKESPDATFFLSHGRAFSYADADTRVSNVTRGLWSCGVRPQERVALVMESRPSLLSTFTALSRLGAATVLVAPELANNAEARPALDATLRALGVRRVVTDPPNAEACLRLEGDTLVLGGGRSRAVPAGALDMEAIVPADVKLPPQLELDGGRARDVVLILLRGHGEGELRAVPITNHRWALSALGAAAACTIKPTDTLYCSVPLHHPTGLVVSTGAALAGGARLALGERFDEKQFLADVRRAGATVVFYAGEMLRPLLHEPATRGDRTLPVRLVAGSGIRAELASRLLERFGVPTLEFYAGTAHRAILADASGKKPGALGRVLPGSAPVMLARCDLARRTPVLDDGGRLIATAPGEPGLLAAKVADDERAALSGLTELRPGPDGDLWFVTADVVEVDPDGDHWFVDSLSGFVRTPGGSVSTRKVEDALYALPEVRLAAAWGEGSSIAASYVSDALVPEARLAEALRALPEHARPVRVTRVERIPLTEGFRPVRGRTA